MKVVTKKLPNARGWNAIVYYLPDDFGGDLSENYTVAVDAAGLCLWSPDPCEESDYIGLVRIV